MGSRVQMQLPNLGPSNSDVQILIVKFCSNKLQLQLQYFFQRSWTHQPLFFFFFFFFFHRPSFSFSSAEVHCRLLLEFRTVLPLPLKRRLRRLSLPLWLVALIETNARWYDRVTSGVTSPSRRLFTLTCRFSHKDALQWLSVWIPAPSFLTPDTHTHTHMHVDSPHYSDQSTFWHLCLLMGWLIFISSQRDEMRGTLASAQLHTHTHTLTSRQEKSVGCSNIITRLLAAALDDVLTDYFCQSFCLSFCRPCRRFQHFPFVQLQGDQRCCLAENCTEDTHNSQWLCRF